MKEFIADKPQTLKEFTDNTYAQGSFFWNYLLKNKDVKVNGKKTGKNLLLVEGDKVAYYLTPAQEEKPAFYKTYEDGNILVVDKESGVNSEAVFAALVRTRECYFLHRLDRNTRGLMAFALNKTAEKELLAAFRERRTEKVYHAVCFGKFPKSADVLTAYLKKDKERALVRIYDFPVPDSEEIVTEYRVLDEKNGHTRAEITLHTGKTHQIRAHLAHIGCPVAGDMKYGNEEENRRFGLARQCLVAKSLRFRLGGALEYLNEKIFLSRFEAEFE